MGENKPVRDKLEKFFGKGCMFIKANIEKRIEKIKGIKSYKKYKKEIKYTRSKIKRYEAEMNYHHLIHKSEGGEISVENGAVVNRLAHQYIHSLPRKQEEIINNMLREYKINFARLSSEGVEDAKEFIPDYSNCIEIPLLDNEMDRGEER